MKRTNLVLDENLLKTATRLLETKTYSEAVNKALAESIRMAKIRGLKQFFGSGVWDANLSEMREDKRRKKRKK
jgi:Arc/MetJ family transcription regulator